MLSDLEDIAEGLAPATKVITPSVIAAFKKSFALPLVAGANIIRFAPSLVIPNEDIAEGLARFEKAVAKLAK